MAVWKLILHHEKDYRGKMLMWARREGRIAIGWGAIGPLSNYRSPEEITRAIKNVPDYLRDLSPSNYANGGQSLWRLYHDMQPGDLVILKGEHVRELVMEIDGEYEWATKETPPFGNYQHQRKAHVRTDLDADALWEHAGGRAAIASNPYETLVWLSL